MQRPAKPAAPDAPPAADLVCDLIKAQRERSVLMKTRIMLQNRLRAIVAASLGYRPDLSDADRKKKFKDADRLIKEVLAGKADSDLRSNIQAISGSARNLLDTEGVIEKGMAKLAAQLPAAGWVGLPAQRGFGLLSFAVVVGECGDLSNYPGPAKVWKRMGCAPHSFEGRTLMGATWQSGKEGKLPAHEWTAFGYSPRRRSVAYVIGDTLLRGNREGPYRARYDEARGRFKGRHREASDLRCHRHGMLLMTKLLLKNLWIEWRRAAGDRSDESESGRARRRSA